jgi:hypothetical protein
MSKPKPFFLRTIALLLIVSLTGCEGVSKGVTEAVLDRKSVDTRGCQIYGPPIEGVRSSLDAQKPGSKAHITKILMVHGVGKHLPDYSNQLQAKLMQALGLDTMSSEIREIKIYDSSLPKDVSQFTGLLRISRHLTQDRSRELLFYELTWSPITDPQKEIIAFDSSDGYTYSRAGLNNSLKSFMNQTVPDLLIYMGNRRDAINNAVAQSVCWMFNGGWDDLPVGGLHSCSPKNNPHMASTVEADDYYFITHSLGSRITVDTVQYFSKLFGESKSVQPLDDVLRNKTMTVFMLANQLPLLQLGRNEPEVSNSIPQYCGANASKSRERMFGKFDIVAFSDPNDILSYPIPADFASRHLDSRICPEVANVSLNISQVHSVLGAADFADPIAAHTGYQDDDRVIGMIADGFSRSHMAAVVKDRCKWTELVQ